MNVLPVVYKSQSYSHPKKIFLQKNQSVKVPEKLIQESNDTCESNMSFKSSEIDSESMETCFQAVCQVMGNFDGNTPPKASFDESSWNNGCSYDASRSNTSNYQFSPVANWTNCNLGWSPNYNQDSPKIDSDYLESKYVANSCTDIQPTDSPTNGYYKCEPLTSTASSSSSAHNTVPCSSGNSSFTSQTNPKSKHDLEAERMSHNCIISSASTETIKENVIDSMGRGMHVASNQSADKSINLTSNSASISAGDSKHQNLLFNKNSIFARKYALSLDSNTLKEDRSNAEKIDCSSIVPKECINKDTGNDVNTHRQSTLQEQPVQNSDPNVTGTASVSSSEGHVTSSDTAGEMTACDNGVVSSDANLNPDKWQVPDSTGTRKIKCVGKKERRWSLGSQNQCQVCGDKAAGFYCGAFVCEACKKFFMRACKQGKVKYLCIKEQKCVITKESRVQCQYCRYQKCLALKMRSPGVSEGKDDCFVTEIPCRVCSAPSSGFHFGALTCEGCKGFFRRMAKERETKQYHCSKGSNCEINSVTRNLCKACRYKKCIDAGMSIDACRIGRQPNSVKHAINLELKQRGQDIGSNGLDFKSLNDPSLDFTNSSTTSATADPVKCEEVIVKNEPPDEEISKDVTEKNTSGPPQEGSSFPVLEHHDYENFIKCYEVASNDIRALQTRSQKSYPINDPTHFRDHLTTWEFMMIEFEWHTSCTIKFAKKLHGFRSLKLEDQVRLVQAAIYPLVILNLSRSFDIESNKFNYFNYTEWEHEMMINFYPHLRNLISHFLHAGQVVKMIGFDEMEYTFLSALLIFNPDVADVEQPQFVEKYQVLMMQMFEEYERRTFSNGGLRFGMMLLRLAEFNMFTVKHNQTMRLLLAEHPELEIPQLYNEMFGSKILYRPRQL